MTHLELFCFERPYGNCNQARSYLTNKDKPTDIGHLQEHLSVPNLLFSNKVIGCFGYFK